MAFKEIVMFSNLVVVIIMSFNLLKSNALTVEPLIDQDFCKVKSTMFEMLEAVMNLMNDSQILNDMQREYFAGKVDYSAVERARNELNKSKNKWFIKVLNYLFATNEFEPTVNYQNSYPTNPYQSLDDLDNYKDNLDEMQSKLINSMSSTLPQPTMVAT